jgi:hypothetical protein
LRAQASLIRLPRNRSVHSFFFGALLNNPACRVLPHCGVNEDHRSRAESRMCDKCNEINEKIEHYRDIAARLSDPLTIERIAELIAELVAQKAALHPEQEK